MYKVFNKLTLKVIDLMDLYPLQMEHTQTRLIIGKKSSYHWQIKTFSQFKFKTKRS